MTVNHTQADSSQTPTRETPAIHDGGWVRLYRSLQHSPVFSDAELWKLYCWCLFRAAHKERSVSMRTGRGATIVTLKPGELITGRKTGGDELGIRPTTFRDRLKKLKELGCIRIRPARHYSIISIVQFGTSTPALNCSPPTNRQATANQSPPNRQATATYKTVETWETVETGETVDQMQLGIPEEDGDFWDEVRELCNRVFSSGHRAKIFGTGRKAHEHKLLLTLGALCRKNHIRETTITAALEAMLARKGEPIANRAGFLVAALDERLGATVNLKRLLQAVHVPETVMVKKQVAEQ